MKKRIMFYGHWPGHVLCFLPTYQALRDDPDIDLFLSGGFREQGTDPVAYGIEGFYDPFPVDRSHILPAQDACTQDFDAVVCAHLADTLFPRAARNTVRIFHSVSFKNLAAYDKTLGFAHLCMPGRHHADMFRKHGLLRADGAQYLMTGFTRADGLVDDSFDRREILADVGIRDRGPTILFAPTGDKRNALETRADNIIQSITRTGEWNLLIKPHDHPENSINWFEQLKSYESNRVRLVRDRDIVPYLRAADLLMTDASSVAVEYTLLDRPIIFVDAPKLLAERKGRAPASGLDDHGRHIGRVVKKEDDIADAIRDSLRNPDREGRLRRKMAEDVFFEPGRACARVTQVVRHAAGLTSRLPNDIEVLQLPPPPSRSPVNTKRIDR